MAAASQQFCLRWNNHQSNFVSHFDSLLKDTLFTDVTLACEGQQIKAHRVVLTACSPYFLSLFKNNVNSTSSTIVLLSGVKFNDLRAIVDFIYKGEVNIGQGQLEGFLKTADSLKVKGLAEVNQSRGSLLTGDSAPAPPVITPPAQRATNAAPKTNSNDSSRSSPPPPKRKRKAASRPDNSDEDEYVPKTKVEMDTSTISSSESKTRKRNKSASASSAAASPDPAQEADDPADPPEPDPDIPPLKTECIELSDEEFDEGSEMDDTRMTGLDGTNDDSLAETSGLNASDAVATPGQGRRSTQPFAKHVPPRGYECHDCKLVYHTSDKTKIYDHFRFTHMPEPFKSTRWMCLPCSRQYTWRKEYSDHKKRSPGCFQFGVKWFLSCPQCSGGFEDAEAFLTHAHTHLTD